MNQCETCEFYDYYDDTDDEKVCTVSMDEDEYAEMAANENYRCPYYRAYDEYKFTRKQN